MVTKSSTFCAMTIFLHKNEKFICENVEIVLQGEVREGGPMVMNDWHHDKNFKIFWM